MSVSRRCKLSRTMQEPWDSCIPNDSCAFTQDYSHMSARDDIISSTPSVEKMTPPSLNVSVIPHFATKGPSLDWSISQDPELYRWRIKLLSVDANVECLQNRALQWNFLEVLAAMNCQSYKHSAECQISTLWREMNVRQKHVAQLQLAIEDAHAEQFKAELIQTNETCVDQIVEELTLCKVEYEKLVLAVDNTRHQLYVSGMDITSEEGELVRELQTCKSLLEGVTLLIPSWKGSKVIDLESTISQLENAILQEEDATMLLQEKVNTFLDQETEGLSLSYH